jgi:tetraprenyl-beta-curcumene synthase
VPPPTNVLTMTPKILLQVRPQVHQHLRHWSAEARRIPSPELRRQALASIAAKTFHCEGAGIYSLLAEERSREALRFIVAYQTISDYLDNLCDRGSSRDAADFRALHAALADALTPGAALADYYRYREERDDGGYLAGLVTTCQQVLAALPASDLIAPYLHELADDYCTLQVYKHLRRDERLPPLRAWFAEREEALPAMAWQEFAAACGSTLGIFCLVAHGCREDCTALLARQTRAAFFPWVQGLHILLDYLVDQEEDRRFGELNFCSYYCDQREMAARLASFYAQANVSVAALPDAPFHHLINKGLLAIYCADRKVRAQKEVRMVARRLVLLGGAEGLLLYLLCWLYQRTARS